MIILVVNFAKIFQSKVSFITTLDPTDDAKDPKSKFFLKRGKSQ